MSTVTYHVVGTTSDLRDGDARRVVVGERAIALFRIDGAFFATGDACTHAFGSLSEGYVEGGEVECPLHGGRFDIRTGEATCFPAARALETYEVRIAGEDILIGVPD